MSITFEQLKARLSFIEIKESEWHQHNKGGGWVRNTAHVDESATVEGIVSGNAQVSGNAKVSGDAQVSGNAQVSGDVWEHSPLQIKGSVHSVTTCNHTEIQIGCQIHTAKEWQLHFEQIGKAHGYTASQIEEYGLIVNLAASWLQSKFGDREKRDAKGRFAKREA